MDGELDAELAQPPSITSQPLINSVEMRGCAPGSVLIDLVEQPLPLVRIVEDTDPCLSLLCHESPPCGYALAGGWGLGPYIWM